ncbi:HAD family hydrolase [Paenibacillus hodogayensis]|uniref:HAD family hydrolase n=1 Tax=Paenibacillus hodogayensis TaxID=279208 RepID=A0ABV5VUD2_9BACL
MVYYNGALVTCKSKQNERHISIPMEISQQINKFIELRVPQSIISYEVNDSWYTCRPVPDSQCAQLGIRSNDPKPQVVDWVLSDIGVKAENVMVFGDDFNDLGLFQMCGFPVAMENAIIELKNGAKHVTQSNDQDGVAVALEKFIVALPADMDSWVR